jgi:probable phosphoglycerate mutase
MKLLLARHGQSTAQVEGESAGLNSPLTALGEQQAERLGAYLADTHAVASIYASDLTRAHHTADIVGRHLGVPITLDPDLREYDDWDAGWAPSITSQWDTRPSDPVLTPGYQRFCDRLLAVLQRIADAAAEEDLILVIAHGGTLGTIWRLLVGSHTPRLRTFNTALHLIEWRNTSWGYHWIFHYHNAMEHLPLQMRTS